MILALISLGLWSRRRAHDIWDKDRVASDEKSIEAERRDVEEILEERPGGAQSGPKSET